jgi:hypothetical protein
LNTHTLTEVAALRRLRDVRFAHVPHRLDWTWYNDVDSGDAQAMPGGYVVWVFITRVAVEPVEYLVYWTKSVEEWEVLRRGVKEALM